MSESSSYCKELSLHMVSTSEVDYEEFVFCWKLNIFSPKHFYEEEMASPVFTGGERGQHSWQLLWQPRMDKKTFTYSYEVTPILVAIGKSDFLSNSRSTKETETEAQPASELLTRAFVTFKKPVEPTMAVPVSFGAVQVGGAVIGSESINSVDLHNKINGFLDNNILTIHCKLLVKCGSKHTPISKSILPALKTKVTTEAYLPGNN